MACFCAVAGRIKGTLPFAGAFSSIACNGSYTHKSTGLDFRTLHTGIYVLLDEKGVTKY